MNIRAVESASQLYPTTDDMLQRCANSITGSFAAAAANAIAPPVAACAAFHSTSNCTALVPPSSSSSSSSSTSSSSSSPFDPRLNGLLSIYKPSGVTSSTLVGEIRRILGGLRTGPRQPMLKVGHGGTLDKKAMGLLIIGIGPATKKLGHYLASEKVYRTRGVLGLETDSHDLDPEARIIRQNQLFGQ